MSGGTERVSLGRSDGGNRRGGATSGFQERYKQDWGGGRSDFRESPTVGSLAISVSLVSVLIGQSYLASVMILWKTEIQ